MNPIAEANPFRLPKLDPQEIHVWRSWVNQLKVTADHWHLLSQDETSRAQGFRRECDRDRYVFTRSILRQLIASYLHGPAAEIQFCYGVKGKPALDVSLCDDALQFNVSHSRNFILWGFSHHALGVDVEYIKPNFQADRIARRFFTEREYMALKAQPLDRQQAFFFTLWTRKESCIKAQGESLFDKIGQLQVPCHPCQCEWRPLSETSLYVQDLKLHPDYRAAIATVAAGLTLSCFDVNEVIRVDAIGPDEE